MLTLVVIWSILFCAADQNKIHVPYQNPASSKMFVIVIINNNKQRSKGLFVLFLKLLLFFIYMTPTFPPAFLHMLLYKALPHIPTLIHLFYFF